MHHRKVSIISYMCITVFTHTHPDTHTRTHTHIYLMYMMRLLMLAHFKFSCSVVSNSAIYGLQHNRLPCSSPITRACSNSCLLSLWCHPTISSSVVPFSSCLQSFPASGSFQMSHIRWLTGQVTSHQVAKLLKFQLQHQSSQWIFRTDII